MTDLQRKCYTTTMEKTKKQKQNNKNLKTFNKEEIY